VKLKVSEIEKINIKNINMRNIIYIICYIFLLSNFIQSQTWNVYTFDNGSFSIAFPGYPEKKDYEVSLQPKGKAFIHVLSKADSLDEEIIYYLIYTDYTFNPLSSQDMTHFYDNSCNYMIKQGNAKVLSMKDSSFNGKYCRDILLSVNDDDNIIGGRLILINNRLYGLQVTLPSTEGYDKIISKFLNSFSLNDIAVGNEINDKLKSENIIEDTINVNIVEKDSTYWLWQAPKQVKGNEEECVLEINCTLGSQCQGVYKFFDAAYKNMLMNRLATNLFQATIRTDNEIIDQKKDNSYYVLNLYPDNIAPDFTDYVRLKRGKIKVNNETITNLNLSGGKTFSELLNEPKLLITTLYYPSIFVQKDSGFLGVGGIIVQFIVDDNTGKVSSPAKTIEPMNAVITGEIRANDKKWTKIRNDLEIKGGGLKLISDGIYLIRGTKYRMINR